MHGSRGAVGRRFKSGIRVFRDLCWSPAVDGHDAHRPGPQIPVLSTAGPTARSVADLRLMLQVICGRHGHGPAVPPVPWRQAGPTELAGPHAAYWPGFPP